MPPSRGHSALLHGSRPCAATSRSATRTSILTSHSRGIAIGRTFLSSHTQRPRPSIAQPLSFHWTSSSKPRYNSTHAQGSAISSDQQPSSLDGQSSGDFYGLDPPASDLLSLGDDRHIGFLYENYGIDFGYGTSSIMKMVFEAVHSTGSEFWVSILLTGFVVRMLIAPANRLVSEESAKMAAMKQITGPLQEKIRNAALSKNMNEMTQLRQQQKKIYKDAGIKPFRMAYNLPQVVVGFGCWRTFWHMADKHVEGLDTGGLLWFENLAIPDPLWILPVVTAGLQFLTFRSNMQDSPELSPGQKAAQRVMMYGLPAIFLPIVGFQPAIIQLHFLTTTSFSGLMMYGFRQPWVRRLLRMTPRVKTSQRKKSNGSSKGAVINATATSKPTKPNSPTSQPIEATAAPDSSMFTRLRNNAANKYTDVRNKVAQSADDITGNRFSTTVEETARKNRREKADRYEKQREAELRKDQEWYEAQRTSRRGR